MISVIGMGFGSSVGRLMQVASAVGDVGWPRAIAFAVPSVRATSWSGRAIVCRPRVVAVSQAVSFTNKSVKPVQTVQSRRMLRKCPPG
jgi:hypothetical protein